MAPKFSYDACRLEPGKGNVRILVIAPPKSRHDDSMLKCSLYVESLGPPPVRKFCALLYCWGVPDFPQDILIDGALFKTTVALEKALKTCRAVGPFSSLVRPNLHQSSRC